jgi:uncharacterized membrane protein YphA (DoxX/SURF4 family)
MILVEEIGRTRAPAAVLLIRLMVGAVFLSEGIQKFLFPAALGVGRFTTIGIPVPNLMAPFVGGVEISCGLLLILGLVTRLAAVPLLIDILVAIATTKIPMLLESGFLGRRPRSPDRLLYAPRVDVLTRCWRWSLVLRRTADRHPPAPLSRPPTIERRSKREKESPMEFPVLILAVIAATP